MESIGRKIAFYRKAKGLTQEELSEKLGVSPQAVSKWENDAACPDIQLLVPLAKSLEVTTDELLSAEPVQLLELVESGMIGELVEVESAEGDIVHIVVE